MSSGSFHVFMSPLAVIVVLDIGSMFVSEIILLYMRRLDDIVLIMFVIGNVYFILRRIGWL